MYDWRLPLLRFRAREQGIPLGEMQVLQPKGASREAVYAERTLVRVSRANSQIHAMQG